MKRTSWISLIAVCLAAAAILLLHLNAGSFSDENKIHQLLKNAETAAEGRNLGLAFSLISPDYHDSAGLRADGIKMQIVRALRSTEHYDILIDKAALKINGDTAHVDTRVTISRISRTASLEEYFSGGVGLNLKKENARKWLVIPVKVWKITSIEGVSGLYGEY
jgi:hypothetical protein